MELVLSLAILGKFFLFLVISFFLGFIVLFPISDQPTSRGQVTFWLFLEVVLFVTMFNIITFKLVA